MLPALSLLQDVPCPGVESGCCDCAVGTVAIVAKGGPQVLACNGDLWQPQAATIQNEIHCSALALSADASIIFAGGIDGTLLRINLSETRSCEEIKLPKEEHTSKSDPVKCIVRNEQGEYAVAVGSHVYIINSQGQLTKTLGPLPMEVVQLSGGPSVLVALTQGACHVWPNSGKNDPIVLNCPNGLMCSLAAAPNSPFIAAACDNCQVACWSVDALLAAAVTAAEGSNGSSADLPDPIILGSYDSVVHCMGWDDQGRYLATSDGPDCTVWDMSAAASGSDGVDDADSVMCCGHDPTTRITCLAFQPEGHFLATVSNSGRLAVFDSRGFRRGGVAGPYATVQIDDAEVGEAQITWLEDSKLLVLAPGTGKLQCYSVGGLEGEVMNGGSGDGAVLDHADSVSTPFGGKACVECSISPLTPASKSGEIPEFDMQASTGSTNDEGMGAAAAAAVAAVESPAGAGGGSALDSAPEATGDINATPRGATPIQTRSSSAFSPLNSNSNQHYEQQAGGRRPGPPPPMAAATTMNGSRLGTSGTPHIHPPESEAPLSSRSNNGRGGRAPGRRTSPGGGGPRSPSGVSPSLLEHIQHIRDTPASPRPDRHEDLLGWGMGIAGGGSLQQAPSPVGSMPWISMSPGGIAHAHASAAPGMYQTYAAVPMQYNQQYQQYQQAMMASAGAGGQPTMVQVAVGPPPAGGQYHHHPGYATSPRSPAAVGPGGMQAGMLGPGGVFVYPQAAATGMMQAPPQGWSAVGYMPQQTQQQAQQWAGVAPGYMRYQHGAQYGAQSAASSQYPTSPRGTAAAGAAAAGPPSPSSLRQTEQATRQQTRQQSGGSGSSGGATSLMSPSSSSARNNAESDAVHSVEEASEAVVNNSAPQLQQQLQHLQSPRRRRSRGSKGSSGMSSAADAAPAAVGSGPGTQTGTPTLSPCASQKKHRDPTADPSPASGPAADHPAERVAAPSLQRSTSIQTSNASYGPGAGHAMPPSATTSPRRPPATVPLPPAPAPVDSSCTIYVGNLPPSVDEYALAWTCGHFGPVAHVQLIRDKATHVSRGFGFVTFTLPAYAQNAMQQLNGQLMYGPFGGQRIKAAPTERTAVKRPPDGGEGGDDAH